MKLNWLLLSIAVLCFFGATRASTACEFNFPENYEEFLFKEEGCAARVIGATNYAGLNYITFFDSTGIDALLHDDTVFLIRNGRKYFVNEEVDDPKTTIKILRQEPAKSIRFGELNGYEEWVEYFVQTLPDFGAESRMTYSGHLSCMTIAVGNKNKSFKTRFCTPKTISGITQLERYKLMLEGIRPTALVSPGPR